jgi:hypothetical protein
MAVAVVGIFAAARPKHQLRNQFVPGKALPGIWSVDTATRWAFVTGYPLGV